MIDRLSILIAGIGGASLGTEVLKSLHLADRYRIFGCDVSAHAFGHYSDALERSVLVNRADYVGSVLKLCRDFHIRAIVPGGEEPNALLSQAKDQLKAAEVHLAGNTPEVTERFSDKNKTFAILGQMGFAVPRTWLVEEARQLDEVVCPCVVKPAIGSGGSSYVFLAADRKETALYVEFLRQNGKPALVQEYIPVDDGEFTVGVLSLPGGRLIGSIALRRAFHAKLSFLVKSRTGLISTGNSQGVIDDFPHVRETAERIAAAIGSEGPLNIQGRVRDGVFLPFEINPRFSASTYLRALAGFNEVDLYLRAVLEGEVASPGPLRRGHYLRSFSEIYVPFDKVVA